MSLATRCTSCGTVFRVVQDQLKVSEGWVRCGRCDEVFNALEGLFDLDRDSPPDWSEAPLPGQRERPGDYRVAMEQDRDTPEEHDPSLVDRIDEQIFGARRSAFGGLGSAERKGPDFADARFDTDLPAEADDGPRLVESPLLESQESGQDSDAPAFILEAERHARWQSSGARKLLASAAALLLLLLASQVLYHYRDGAAARSPALRSALVSWCTAVGCTIEAPRRIEDVSVESTALSRAGTADSFRLSVVLRNRSATLVAMPWVELSLTDPNGQLVARRALSPQDLRVRAASLDGGAETSLQALLSTGAARVTGYTVEVFYP